MCQSETFVLLQYSSEVIEASSDMLAPCYSLSLGRYDVQFAGLFNLLVLR